VDQLTLNRILADAIAWHIPGWVNAQTYFVSDSTKHMYAVLIAPNDDPADLSVLIAAHIEGDHIIIDTNTTDQSLSEALQTAGVPAAQIKSAVRSGEAQPERGHASAA
jgi:hypothetical protein